MKLNDQQEKGLKIAVDRYNSGEKFTVIAGYAGTGKSTLVRHIIDALDIEDIDVVYTSFTGKATLVLANKGCPNTMTLTKLLYDSFPLPNGKFRRLPKITLDYPYKIVVVDEISMAPKDMMQLLFKHNVHIICLGDPFQLPPITNDNLLLAKPHIFLTEIMRQEEDSEIINLTLGIREGKPLVPFKGESVQIIRHDELNTGMLMWADQIICATNNTRNQINRQKRQLLGFGAQPQAGDRLICLRNYWDDIASSGNSLVNGCIGEIDNLFTTRNYELDADILNAKFTSDIGEDFGSLEIDYQLLTTGNPCLSPREAFKIKNKKIIPKEFDYGYCITCHKSQGSEYNNVLLLEENFPFDKKEHARWLYTGATRAIDKLLIRLKD